MDLKTAPVTIMADLYIIIIDPESSVWSGLDCSPGLKPTALNFSFPGDLSLRNAPLWSLTLPSSIPPLASPGIYTFYIGTTKPGTSEFISNLATLKIEVYQGGEQ